MVIGVRARAILLYALLEADFGFMQSFYRELLAEYGLTSEICCKHFQLGANIELVRQCPGTPMS